MPYYARETTVPVERTRIEIEECLRKYGASAFQSGWNNTTAGVVFQLHNLLIRITLPLPKEEECRVFSRRRNGRMVQVQRNDNQLRRAVEQETRQRWRALLLVIKAKLEAVDCHISTLEEEFLAFVVCPGDVLFGQWARQHALPAIRQGQMPKQLTHFAGTTSQGEADGEVN